MKKCNLCIRRAAAGNYRFWLTVLRLVRAKKPGNPSELPGFLHAIPPKPPDQSCAAPRKRQIMMHGRKLSAGTLWGNLKKLCAKIAFQVRWLLAAARF